MTSALNVILAGPQEAAVWDSFVAGHASSTFFHRYGWGDAIEQAYGHEPVRLMAVQDGQVVGVLPLVDRRSALFGKALISVGFTVGGGVLGANDEATAALLLEAETQGVARSSEYVELRSIDQRHEGWHEKHGIYDNFSCPIAEDEDVRLKAIPRKKRADIRKAIKAAANGHIRTETNQDVDAFWQHYARAQRDHGTPVFPRRWLAQQAKAFGDDFEIAWVYADDEPLAGVVNYYHRDTIYLYSAFISGGARRYHAGDYLYWWLMGHGLSRGATIFDLGRSKRGTGSHAYKTYWGIEPDPMVYLYRLMTTDEMPNVNPQNPKFAMMTKVWRQLPLPVANLIGPHVAGHLA